MDLLIFSDDWGRHPSSCQHLTRHWLPNHQIQWVNTIGTRRPTLDWYTFSRGFQKIGGWLSPREVVEETSGPAPDVVAPLMWPSFRSRAGRWLNAQLLERSVAKILPRSERRVAITTLPIVADLVGRLPVDRWVYYCVDDLSEWPGLDKASLLRMERDLIDRVDDIVVVSENLRDKLTGLGRVPYLLTHGVDPTIWRDLDGTDKVTFPAVPQGPTVVFWGVIDPRFDIESIVQLSKRLSTGSIVLVGPENNADPVLRTLGNVFLTGPVPFEQLPGVACTASVLIMPYIDSPATRAMQPLKLKEYLCTGKPVVCADLPALAEWGDSCDVYHSADEFVDWVCQRLDGGIPLEQRLDRERLTDETWENKAAQFMNVLSSEVQHVAD